MGDVYVEAGDVKSGTRFPAKQLPAAQVAGKQAMANFIRKQGSGMTSQKPGSGAGVRVNVILSEFVEEKGSFSCKLIGELFELPKNERKTTDLSARGEGKVIGEKPDAALIKCVDLAVTEMMTRVAPSITAPPPTVKSNFIYIGPFKVTYTKDAKKAPPGLAEAAIKAVTAMMDRLVKRNGRLLQGTYQTGSGVPGYTLKISVDEVAVDQKMKVAAIKTKGEVTTYPDDQMFVLGLPGTGKVLQSISDKDLVLAITDLAEGAVQKAIRAIIDKNPPP